MSNSFAFGYLYAKCEEINCDPNGSFSDIINYANEFSLPNQSQIVWTFDLLEEICAIYSHCDEFDYDGREYWIVGDDGFCFGIVYLENNRIKMLEGAMKDIVYEAYKADNERRRVSSAIQRVVEVAKEYAIKVKRVNAKLEQKKKEDGGIYLLDTDGNIYDPETREQIGIVLNGRIVIG